MPIERIRSYPYPEGLDSIEKIKDYLRRLHASLNEEAVMRIEDHSIFSSSTHATEHEVGGSDLVNHDSLTGFVADEHVAHSGVTLTATAPLSGGGTIAANRSFGLAVDATDLAVDGSNQLYVVNTGIDHDACTNFVAAEHVDYSSAIDNTNYCVKSPIRFRVSLSASQNNIVDNTATLVQFDTEQYDTGSDFNTTTYTWTCPATGYYLFIAQLSWTTIVAAKVYGVQLYDTTGAGTLLSSAYFHSSLNANIRTNLMDIQYVPANNTITVRAYHNDGTNNPDIQGAAANASFFAGHLLST